MVFCLRTQPVSLEIAFFFCNLLVSPAFLGFKIACVGFCRPERPTSSAVGAASFFLLFSSSWFCCMTYLMHCKANTKWRQERQWNGTEGYGVWTWTGPSVWVQRGKSAIDFKTPSEFGRKHCADSCLCEGFQLSVILKIPFPNDTIRCLSPFPTLQYMSNLYYWSICMFYSILYHWQMMLLPLQRWGRGWQGICLALLFSWFLWASSLAAAGSWILPCKVQALSLELQTLTFDCDFTILCNLLRAVTL